MNAFRLYKLDHEIAIGYNEAFYSISTSWDELVNRDDLHAHLQQYTGARKPSGDASYLKGKQLLAPIGTQEVWAAGVTYYRSKVARMEEAKDAGGGDFYDKVYDAPRPEIFFKATPHRVVGPGGLVAIRKDSTWDVPEPELTLFMTASGKIVGYTIGNDMSSRSIEGENPLYLPQAKTYDRSAAIGPCLYVIDTPLPQETSIDLKISRNGKVMFEGLADLAQMKRKPEELRDYLFRACTFPQGCYLMTGTCVVPDHTFTLQPGDEIAIRIEGIGELINTVG